MTGTSGLLAGLRSRLPDPLPPRLGVAVSGGSDSTALLHLLSRVYEPSGLGLHVATVDHGLRPESAAEAATVAGLCHSLNIPHTTLHWSGWQGAGNLQDQARRARYGLLRDWALAQDIPAIALGHTADDQAETVLMRLGRAAGVTGLSAMPTVRMSDGVSLYRPLLFATREQLRAYLVEEGLGWADDPSNQDPRFDRIKARRALAQLSELGITADSLSRVAENLGQANHALERYAQDAARGLTKTQAGSIRVERAGFSDLPQEVQRRLVVGIVRWIAGGDYPPRQSAVEQAVRATVEGRLATVGGCLVVASADSAWFCRELKPVAQQVARPGAVWDRRWIVSGPNRPGVRIRALSEAGLQHLPDWRSTGLPRAVLLATPAVWSDGELLSGPVAGWANGWQARIDPAYPALPTAFLSH